MFLIWRPPYKCSVFIENLNTDIQDDVRVALMGDYAI